MNIPYYILLVSFIIKFIFGIYKDIKESSVEGFISSCIVYGGSIILLYFAVNE